MKKKMRCSGKTFFLLTGVFLISIAGWELYHIYGDYKVAYDEYRQISGEVISYYGPKTDSTEAQKEAALDPVFWYREYAVDFEKLQAINPDTVGFIRFDQAPIEYPILYGKDNETYLYRTVKGTKSKSGSIFLECGNNPDFTDKHSIIYGHNMKNLSMFGMLRKYKSTKNFYEDNRYFTIYTPEYARRYEVFSYYTVDAEDEVYQIGFRQNEEFEAFVGQMQKRSYLETGIEVTKADTIVTLSTCTNDNGRFVVHAKLIQSEPAHANDKISD